MDFDLIHCGSDFGVFEDRSDALLCEVGEADGFRETFVVEFLHCSPSGLGILGEGFVDHILKDISLHM